MNGILVETDVIAGYLLQPAHSAALLRRLLQSATCYTTFIPAAEIYGTAQTADQMRIVERALFGLKILGASGRYAKTIGRIRSSSQSAGDFRFDITAATAIESGLPIVTERHRSEYERYPGVVVIGATALAAAPDGELRQLLAPYADSR